MTDTSSPTIVKITNDDSHINEKAPFLNEPVASNNLSNLSDSFTLDKTGKNKLPFPDFVEKVFYRIRQTTTPRYQCLLLITWPYFEYIIMFLILLNCIILGMYEPCAQYNKVEPWNKCSTVSCTVLHITSGFIFVLFIIEMCIKMIAMGVLGEGTYLANSWNRFDCFIVLAGSVEFLITTNSWSLSVIRTVRVLRPLRIINRIPSMRIIVQLLLDTLPILGNILLLWISIFFIFGFIGVQLWKGLLRKRCFLQFNETSFVNYELFNYFSIPPFYTPSDDKSFICSDPLSSGMTKCSEIPPFRRDKMTCKLNFDSWDLSLNQTMNGCINWNHYYRSCVTSDQNPFSGTISFDDIRRAWTAILQIITLEKWSIIMYYVQDAHSFWNWIYFVCLIIVGSYVMINLCLFAISAQLNVTKKREIEKMLAEQKQFIPSTNAVRNAQAISCWEKIINYFQQLSKNEYQRLSIFWKNSQYKHDKINQRYDEKIITTADPLINQNHRPNCRYYQLQSLLSTSPNNNLSFIEKNRENKTSLEIEQQIEQNNICDCYHQDEIVHRDDKEEENSKCDQRSNSCCCSSLKIIQTLISRLVANKYFDGIIFLAIIINTFLIAIEYHGQPQFLTNLLQFNNYFFTILFTIEILLKIIAHGCLAYIKNLFNIFDGGIVLISLIQLIISGNSGLSVLRAFRLLCLLKFLRCMPTLRRHLIVMIKTADSVAICFLLLLLCVLIFSIIGVHFFGGAFCIIQAFNTTSQERFDMKCHSCACVKWHLLKTSTDLKDLKCIQQGTTFDSLPSALLTVFQISIQKDWTPVPYNVINKTSAWSVLYFIALIVFSNYILLNLLIAVLVERFVNEKEDGAVNSDSNNDDKKHSQHKDLLTSTLCNEKNLIEPESNIITNTDINLIVQCRSTIDNSQYSSNQNPSRQENKNEPTNSNTNSTKQIAADTQLPIIDVSTEENTQFESKPQKLGIIESCFSRCCGQRIFGWFKERENYSLYLFSPSNKLRKVFQRLILEKLFDYLILFFIVLNCITLAMERPSISSTNFERQLINYTNYICTIIFIIEMMIKIIASGLIVGSNTYLRSGWNVVDGFLVIIAIIDFGIMHRYKITSSPQSDTTSDIADIVTVFRLLRALIPLRVINRAPGVKFVVPMLLSSLKAIANVCIIFSIFFIIFGILGVQLFKGKFYYCEGPLAHNVPTRKQCEMMSDHQWRNQEYNFDNLGQALLTLLALTSKDDSIPIMYMGVNTVEVDMQPIKYYSKKKLIYFISFLLVFEFYGISTFVGVVVENFHNYHIQQKRNEETRKQRKPIEHQKHPVSELPYYTHFSPWRKRLYDICVSKYFDLIITVITGIYVVTISCEFYLMPVTLDIFLKYCNYVFMIIFLLEFILKIVALGPLHYFKDKWNLLDSFLLLALIADIILEKIISGNILPISATLIRMIRLVRIARVLKLLKMIKGIRSLLSRVSEALPHVGNLGLLLFLQFFIFAILAVELFGKLECSQEQPCSGLSKHANFKNFGIALLTLFRIATGDNWNDIMKDTLRQNDLSITEENKWTAMISPIYFVTFVTMTTLVLTNMVVVVLLKNLENSNKMTN
ncbi:unnamed protein product, partial [Rotaria sordida]